MPILIDLQRGVTESGRIRIGQLVPSRNGSRPSKLDTFRLTSADRRRIEQAAELYGGTVTEWTAPAGKQWQVITATDSLEVVVPPSAMAFSQWLELWSAGGCQRRCDGVTEQLTQGPCRCNPEARECDYHTRLSVLLRDLPGLGVWRLDTQGWYAARELRGAVEMLAAAAGHGALLPARLRLEQRSVKRIGANGKPETRRFAVPVLDIEVSPAQLLAGGAQPIPLEQAALPAFTPVPQLPMHEGASIAEQSAPPPERPKRSNAAAEIPASGRTRATRATEQPAQGADESEPADTPEASVGEEIPPAPASPSERPPIEVMVELAVEAKGGGDTGRQAVDAIRTQLGYERWEDAPAEVIAQLTAKAQKALMDQAEAIATSDPEYPNDGEPPGDSEPTPATKKPARRSRAKKES